MGTWRKAACAATSLVVAGVMTTAPAGAKAGTGCDRGYLDPGAVTLEEGLALPRIADGLAADPAPYTLAQLTSLFDAIDGNDDGYICLKAVSQLQGNSAKHHGFFYLADDNSHPGD
jgi:hypothetical protein